MQSEEQKVQELLKPRWKVIADYPSMPFSLNEIITEKSDPLRLSYIYRSVKSLDELAKFPHIFKRLEWWEERDASEMPEYVKYAENGMVAKVDRFDLETSSAWFMYLEGGFHPYSPGGSALENTHWLPATAADYHAYKQPA